MKKLLLILFAVLLVSCATTGQVPQTPYDLARDQGIIWDKTYNNTFENVKTVLNDSNSTPAMRSIALKEREILIKVHPWLVLYADAIDKKETPDAIVKSIITKLMEELEKILTEENQ